jgi:hypothetical protein
MSKWYIVMPSWELHGIQDTKMMDGVYIAERILPVGAMVPLEWKGQQRVRDLYLPSSYMEEYTPLEEDWPILYALWPSLRPLNYKGVFVPNSRVGTPEQWASGWYKISEPDGLRNMSSVPYGYAALCDIDGICRAGDIAMSGEIVPAAFFAGLNLEQFDRLETIGLCSQSWLNKWPERHSHYMRGFARPVMERVMVSPSQKAALLEKYPALQAKNEVPETKTISRKTKK